MTEPFISEEFHLDNENKGRTSFAKLNMTQMDPISSVANILGPDPQDDSMSMDELLESSIEERNELDGQSFASVEEMDITRNESASLFLKTNHSKQINGLKNMLHGFKSPLSPSPCLSRTTSILLQSEIARPNASEVPPTSTVFPDSRDSSGTSVDTDDEGIELAIEEEFEKDEKSKKRKISLSLTNRKEKVQLEQQNIISTPYLSDNALSAVSVGHQGEYGK